MRVGSDFLGNPREVDFEFYWRGPVRYILDASLGDDRIVSHDYLRTCWRSTFVLP